MPLPTQPLMDMGQVVELLNVSSKMITVLVKSGDLKALNIRGQYRFRVEDVERFIEKGSQNQK